MSEWRRATGARQHLVQKAGVGRYCYRTRTGALLDAHVMDQDELRGMKIVEKMAKRYAELDFDKKLSAEERKRAQFEVFQRALSKLRSLGGQR